MRATNWQSLSKKERRRLKKEQKRLKRNQAARKSQLKKWSLLLGVVVLLAGGAFLYQYIQSKTYANAPKIQILPLKHDFGKVLASEGIVETSFEVKNVGVSPLTISGMETSCGCTIAKLKVGEEESPEFSMHDNPTNWSVSIELGTVAELVVVFDPNFHKNTFGPVTRTVSIFSNDPWNSKERVTIEANVSR